MLYKYHKYIIKNKIAIFFTFKITTEYTALITIKNVFVTICMTILASLLPKIFFNTSFKIFPPSNGNIGSKLKAHNTKLVYINFKANSVSKLQKQNIIPHIKLNTGPAKYVIIFIMY